MAFTTEKFKVALRESWSSFLFFLFLLAVAVALSYLEEFLRRIHRPEPIPTTAHYGSNLALLADFIVFGKMLYDAVTRMWSKPNEPRT
jgi:hypothetical protein